ncbi:hypothetical protein SXCC_02061 [Gluconacetobacter sp. SXCC-1]|nr:hypothetical protein SXCC_02061 [Gluconacetobacter sp. SXCC-1]
MGGFTRFSFLLLQVSISNMEIYFMHGPDMESGMHAAATWPDVW